MVVQAKKTVSYSELKFQKRLGLTQTVPRWVSEADLKQFLQSPV